MLAYGKYEYFAMSMLYVMSYVHHVATIWKRHTPFNIYTSDLPPPSAPVQVMAYADDITVTSTHTSTSAAEKYIQPYLHEVFAWTKQNNFLLNPDKTTCTLFTLDPAEYMSISGPNNKQQRTTHGKAPKCTGFYFRPKTHIQQTHPQHIGLVWFARQAIRRV